ncbi:MAG: lipase family protein [Cyanobacteria bacterium J06621_8]
MTTQFNTSNLGQRFDPDAKDFCAANMAYLAHCAQAIYKPESDCKDAIGEIDSEIVQGTNMRFVHSRTTGTEGFIAGDQKKIIIAFRGTSEIKDWLTDAATIQKSFSAVLNIGKVHSGFFRSLNSVWSIIVEHLEELQTQDQPIWITGHSLGGALAALAYATLRLQEPKYELAGAYTFGQPRIGNSTMCEAFDADAKHRFFRVVNNNDIVPRVPSKLIRKGLSIATFAARAIHDVDSYEDMGTQLYFDANGKLIHDATFMDRLAGRFEGYKNNLLNGKINLDSIEDHSMTDYRNLAMSELYDELNKKDKN